MLLWENKADSVWGVRQDAGWHQAIWGTVRPLWEGSPAGAHHDRGQWCVHREDLYQWSKALREQQAENQCRWLGLSGGLQSQTGAGGTAGSYPERVHEDDWRRNLPVWFWEGIGLPHEQYDGCEPADLCDSRAAESAGGQHPSEGSEHEQFGHEDKLFLHDQQVCGLCKTAGEPGRPWKGFHAVQPEPHGLHRADWNLQYHTGWEAASEPTGRDRGWESGIMTRITR